MIGVLVAAIAAVGFIISAQLALAGNLAPGAARAWAIAGAAGALLALAFADLFPDALGLAGNAAAIGFVIGFASPILVESFTRGHTHHTADEAAGHPLGPFIAGLAIHNFADGVALGVGDARSTAVTLLLGIGILAHQLPVGLSTAAVLAASQMLRRLALAVIVLLGLAIPLGALAIVALPIESPRTLGTLTAFAGGVIAYLGTSHLLPEARSEHPRASVGLVFVTTLALVTGLVLFVFSD